MASSRARQLRTNPTDAERTFWTHTRRRQVEGCRFRRQQPLGPYVVDFFCPERKLIVEIDGGQHAVHTDRDGERTAWLESRGYRVVRYWNNEVLSHINGVLDDLRSRLADR